MSSISDLGFARGLSESRMVALASRAAALGVAALVVALVGLFEIETPGGGLSLPVVNAVMIAPTVQAPREARQALPRRAEIAVASASTTNDGEPEWPHLWTYDAQGRIVFRTNEQLARCSNARQRGREEADCPSSFERTPMVSRQG